MSLDAATGSVDDAHAGSAHVHGAHADRSAAAQQGRRQQVLLFGSAFLVFAAVAVVLGAGRRPYPDGFISAAAFPFGIWMLTAAVVLLGAGIAALTSPLFSVPWVLLIADAELSATPADTVVKWLWTGGIVLIGAGFMLSVLARRRVRNRTRKRRAHQRH